MRANRELHVLAAFVHGALVALHTLGVLYNLKRHNRWQTCAHVAGVAFSLDSTLHHVRVSHEPDTRLSQ